MVIRSHLVAAFGVSPETFARFVETPGRDVGAWRVSICSSVSARDSAILDHRLALLSRETGALVLRASQVKGRYAVLAVQRDGRYLAIFDHTYGGLECDLREPFLPSAHDIAEGRTSNRGSIALDAPVPPERLGELGVRDDEILARLHAGETPRSAWESVVRDRAAFLAAELAAAGVEGVEPCRLEKLLYGDGTDRELDPFWGDLPDLLDAMGLVGLAQALASADWPTTAEHADTPESEDEVVDDDNPSADGESSDAAAERSADEDGKNPFRSGKVRALLVLLAMLGGALGGGLLARRYDSVFAVVGGAALGFVLPVVLLVAAFAAWLMLGAIRIGLFSWRHRRGPAPEDRTRFTRGLPPSSTGPARRAIALWSELRHELDRDPAHRATPATLLYPDVFLPTGSGSRELLSRLEHPGEIETLDRAFAELRLELLDRRLRDEPVEDLKARFRRLLAAS